MNFTHKLISTFILIVLFSKSFAQTTDSLAMAQVAQKLVFPVTISKGQKMLPPIISPSGYQIELKGSDHLPVIALDGKITEPITGVNVNLFYQLTNQSNHITIDLPTVSLFVPGKFVENKSNNPKPFVIPALQEWHGGTGSFKIGKQSRIVIKDKDQDLAEVAALLKKDLQTYHYNLKIATDKPKKGDIVLSLDSDDNSLGNEGYYLDIDQQISMTAFKKRGLIWATRTLLQLLEQTGTKADLPKGICRDYPKYEVRGLVLDVARKFFTIDFLRDYVKFMSYYKMSEFHIHLNDNGFHSFFNNDWNKVKAAFRLENSTYPTLTANDGHYSKKEFKDLQQLAASYGVDIIPEIDVPAHSLAISRVMPEIGSKKYGMDHLDLYNPKTYEVVSNIFKEYLEGPDPVFKGKVMHIGTDEYDKAEAEKFRYFTDYFIKYVQGFGKEARVWGALTHAKGTTPVTVNNVTMNAWYNGYAEPKEMKKLGYKLISTPDGLLYIVPAAGYYYDYLNLKSLYRKWEPINVGKATFQAADPTIRGGSFAVWNDHSPAGNAISERDVHDRVFPAMQVLSQKMWSGTADTIAFVEFQSKSKRIKEGPGINIAGYVKGNDSLVLHYNFDQKSIKDQSVYKRGNAVKENVDMGKGRSGKSAVLSASNSFIQLPLKEIGYNYTVSFQIKPYQGPAGEKILFSTANATVKSSDQDGKFGFSREGYDYQFDYKLPSNQWTLITVTGNNNGTSLFVNGKLQERLSRKEMSFPNSKSKAYKMQTLVFPLQTLGDRENGFIGEIDDLKIYNKELTDKEIEGL